MFIPSFSHFLPKFWLPIGDSVHLVTPSSSSQASSHAFTDDVSPIPAAKTKQTQYHHPFTPAPHKDSRGSPPASQPPTTQIASPTHLPVAPPAINTRRRPHQHQTPLPSTAHILHHVYLRKLLLRRQTDARLPTRKAKRPTTRQPRILPPRLQSRLQSMVGQHLPRNRRTQCHGLCAVLAKTTDAYTNGICASISASIKHVHKLGPRGVG